MGPGMTIDLKDKRQLKGEVRSGALHLKAYQRPDQAYDIESVNPDGSQIVTARFGEAEDVAQYMAECIARTMRTGIESPLAP